MELLKLFIKNFMGIFIANNFRSCRIKSLGVSSKSFCDSREIEVLNGSFVDSTSSIGSYTYIGRNAYVTKTVIGRYCSIANNVSIGQGEHALDRISTSSKFYDDPWETLTTGECVIESDVWIGVDAIVLRGVKIGVGAIIAANAVVTKDVPPFAIVGGVPAKLIRFRFSTELQNHILESSWWNQEYEEAKKITFSLAESLNKV